MKTLLSGLLWIVILSTTSADKCIPSLMVKETTSSSITVKWECMSPNPTLIEEYALTYARRTGDYIERGKSALVQPPKQEFTLEDLTCGTNYQLFLRAVRSNDRFSDISDSIEAKVGGFQRYPERKEFLEVDETSVTLKMDIFKLNCDVETLTTVLKNLALNEKINETFTKPSVGRLVFSGLEPNTEYELQVGDPKPFIDSWASYTFRTLCEEKALVAPSKDEFLQVHPTYCVLRLEKWECVDTFAVEYRKNGLTHWNLVSNDTKAEQRSLIIQQLFDMYAYDVRITAKNRFGSTVAEYDALEYVSDERTGCGDWISLGNKCVKVLKEAGLLSKKDAQEVCKRFKDGKIIPTLLTVKTPHEQWNRDDAEILPGTVWLGLHSDDGEAFHWDDGAEVEFPSWHHQVNHDKSDRCVVMLNRPYQYTFGKWQRVKCNTLNYVVCEKPPTVPLGIKNVLTIVGQLDKRLTQAEEKIKALEKN